MMKAWPTLSTGTAGEPGVGRSWKLIARTMASVSSACSDSM
jgi:hypothetical protein